jgi:hypothetical protein
MDKSKNKFGNLLLNFCKGNSMFIVNGRVGNDKNIGRFTCRNASVVDYCITSPELLKLFFDFDRYIYNTKKYGLICFKELLITFEPHNIFTVSINNVYMFC